MLMLLRHLASVAALPFVVTLIVPFFLARRYEMALRVTDDIRLLALAVLALAIGMTLFVASLYNFATRGRGTLAPWDPPRNLVVTGPYRYVRNPMISGVVFLLAGEALLLASVPHAIWALIFTIINLIYIPLLEEPRLEDRFGEAYRDYRRNVPRILPRLRPWTHQPRG